MTTPDQQDELTASAALLVEALKEEGWGRLINFDISECYITNTQGWYIDLAIFDKSRPVLGLWLEYALDRETRGYWVGFHEKKAIMDRFLKDLNPKDFQNLGTADYEQEEHARVLVNVPERAQDGFPVFDKGWKGAHYYGIYGRVGQPFDTARFSMFLSKTFKALPEFNTGGIYNKIENKRIVGIHQRFDRSKLLAKLCKERDGYRCQVCDLSFVEVYGELGLEFAEAHHTMHLSKLV
ncbi:hypothetical protein, partial [Beijerinckia sp. L45]|uniref:hypothetical protein n=1 Tax=Beijerinckia sp. L45 TaxID=1641855 RepID=UPI001AED5564